MSESSNTPEDIQTAQHKNSELSAEKTPRLMSRRTLLKRAFFGLSALGAAAMGGKAVQVAMEHPELLEKTARSIESGKILKDIQEVVESRLHLNQEAVAVTNFEAENKYPVEPWMSEVAESFHILETERNGKNYPLLQFDITHTSEVVPVQRKETQPNDHSFARVFYDLGETVREQKVLTLPAPQYQFQTQTEQKIPNYLQYRMFAWAGGQSETSGLEYTGKRGGVVLKNDTLQVVTPEEFLAEYQKTQSGDQSVSALMEYAFIIDSEDLEGSFKAMEEASSTILKDVGHSTELTNCLVTIHLADRTFKSFLLACYEPDLSKSLMESNDSSIKLMNAVQLASVAEQLKEHLGGVRFTVAITDPSPEAANCYAPASVSVSEIQEKGYAHEPAQYQDWMPEINVDKTYMRTVGSGNNFYFPQYSFPWVLATKK